MNLNSQDLGEVVQKVIRANSTEEVSVLIEKNPDLISYKQFDNRNILFRLDESKLEIIEFLLKQGANPNDKDDGGWTPMTYNNLNFQLYELYGKYGGEIVISNNPRTDYISWLIHGYTNFRQSEILEIIKSVLKSEEIDLNKFYDNGLTLSHMITINYLTYSQDTDFTQLIALLEENGMSFNHHLKKEFHDEELYPYRLKAGDGCLDIIEKVSNHSYYNGKDLELIQMKCSH